MQRTRLHLWWQSSRPPGFRTAVSLHSHTQHSWETLRWLGTFRSQWPILPFFLGLARAQHRRRTGRQLDLARTYWIPPLDTTDAWTLETRQIAGLGWAPLVSLSDHDDIEAGMALAKLPASAVSIEWTVPFGPTFFHLGVHNLPPTHAPGIARRLANYTASPFADDLGPILESISGLEQVLVVLNHPLWDEACIGKTAHVAALQSLHGRCAPWIHAVELNGLRSWAENSEAIHLARAWGKPVVSGGDRHGREPNSVLNLTNASSFAEFVAEVRRDRSSQLLLLPQYQEPLRLRWLQTVADVFRNYPDGGRRRLWTERFFYEDSGGERRPLSDLWDSDRAGLLQPLLAFLRASEWSWLRPALRRVLADASEAAAY